MSDHPLADLPPRGKEPTSKRHLDAWIEPTARAAWLELGTGLQARATADIDLLFRGDFDDVLAAPGTRLAPADSCQAAVKR